MLNRYRIAAVITLYNPDDKVIQRSEKILPYVEKLYLVDNSENPNRILKSFVNNKVEYIQNYQNLGIAEALNIAVKKAISERFTFLLTLDQDSYFENDSLQKLILSIRDEEDIAIYSPFHKNKFFTNPPKNLEFEEMSDVMTSGNLLNLSIAQRVGFFREDYFIDYVDIEYCLRLRKNGYKILRINSSMLLHNEANLTKKSFFGRTVYPPNHKPFRWYYKIRNYLYLRDEYVSIFPEYFTKEKVNIRNNIIKLLLFEPKKFSKLKYIIKGFFDYKKNIKGKLK